MDVRDISDRLFDIAGELKIVIAALDSLHPYSVEGYGFYLMLNRHVDDINAIRDELFLLVDKRVK